MSLRRILPLTLLVAAATAAASATPAAAIDARFKAEYLFRVSVEGTQTTTWSSEDAGLSGCFEGERGDGSQVVRFASKPVTMHAYEGVPQPFFFKKGDRGEIELGLRGTVDRRASMTCADPYPREEPAPDCGTKPFSGLKVFPHYLFKRNRVILEQPYGSGVADFDRCPIQGLVSEFKCLRRSHLKMIRHFPAEAWDYRGVVLGQPASLRGR